MPPLKKSWQISPPVAPDVERALFAYPPVLRQLLSNRDIKGSEAAERYILASPPPGTEPENLLSMPVAVERVQAAITNLDSIAIYGDYDADGVTATALLVSALERAGARVTGYIPNRFDEGYGLNIDALANLKAQGVQLVITVDCGIRSIEEVAYARQIGLDLIISDHHHPTEEIPPALAIINPKQPGDAYPDKDLAGVGLAYKLATAIYEDPSQTAELLDLVALGTVADLAPLAGENRSLVRRGLDQIRKPRRQGVLALIGASGLKPDRINAGDIGYTLGPRLNAAGRLESALAALELLLSQDVYAAASLAQKLDAQNRERQQVTREIQAQAEQIALAENPDALLLFASDPGFNPGVVGLAASRLTELYYRPSIVAFYGEETTRGSCRSIPEFHITDALDRCADLLVRHGGHAAAAGFTVRNENLPELRRRLQEIAQQELGGMVLKPVLHADMQIPLSELKPELLHYIDLLQPTGFGNRQAYFISRDLKPVSYKSIGKEGKHLRLVVTDGRITFDAVAFNQGHWAEAMPPRIDLFYSFELNEFNGRTSLQLNVRDLKPSASDE
jgi:single-stranded-DNA-specific exonuclease